MPWKQKLVIIEENNKEVFERKTNERLNEGYRIDSPIQKNNGAYFCTMVKNEEYGGFEYGL